MRLLGLTLLASLTCSTACAQEERPLEELESWIILEEESAPEPPFLRLHLGYLGWIETRTTIRSDRGAVRGSNLDDLEQEQGLDGQGHSPWIELSLGSKVRGGVDGTWLQRPGVFKLQEEDLFFDGVQMAEPGDAAKAQVELLTLGGFVEWDFLYGRTYRIGLVGGLRYFRFHVKLRASRASLRPATIERRVGGELVSPYFGGLVELNPFPYLSVFTRVQFMNWSWDLVDLKAARFLEFRLGVTVMPVPGVFGIGVEYRFMNIFANVSDDRRVDGSYAGNGIAATINLLF